MTHVTSTTLIEVITKIPSMGYLKGAYNKSEADKKVLDEFLNGGFTIIARTEATKKNPIISQIQNMPNGSIMSQPFGNNNNPDFIVKVNGHFINIEMKSSQDGRKALFNSAVPKPTTIYLLSCQNYGNTHFMGSTIINKERRSAFLSRREEIFNLCGGKGRKGSKVSRDYYSMIPHANDVQQWDYPRHMYCYEYYHYNDNTITRDESQVISYVNDILTAAGTGLYQREDDLEYMVSLPSD